MVYQVVNVREKWLIAETLSDAIDELALGGYAGRSRASMVQDVLDHTHQFPSHLADGSLWFGWESATLHNAARCIRAWGSLLRIWGGEEY
jgi:hypothetical protein